MFSNIIHIIFLFIFSYCAISVGYLLLMSLAGRFFYKEKYKSSAPKPFSKIAILVPGYKEDGVILSTAKNLLALDYPKELYDVFIIADSFSEETLIDLNKLPVHVLEVFFKKSTKAKSLNEAFKRINKNYEVALICDADNMLAPDFLRKVNRAFSNGAKAIQGRRVAKNLDSSYAILDASSEAINNNIFRKGTYALGLSSAVIGSGMAFDFSMIKELFLKIEAVGGFDKILQLKIVEQKTRIHYLESALIFDEKVDSSEAFEQQRKRWVSSQAIYLKRFFFSAFKQLFKGNISYFNLAVANNLVPPRAFLFIILPGLIAAAYFLMPFFWVTATVWLLSAYVLCLAVALPFDMLNKKFFIAIVRLPKAIFVMFGALFHIKKSNKTFIHTVHTKTQITNSLFNEHSR
jgi:cellulose synthase/poly-beta-1,6-N-acetylglucosamine synthase-like glycosyltransferase